MLECDVRVGHRVCKSVMWLLLESVRVCCQSVIESDVVVFRVCYSVMLEWATGCVRV